MSSHTHNEHLLRVLTNGIDNTRSVSNCNPDNIQRPTISTIIKYEIKFCIRQSFKDETWWKRWSESAWERRREGRAEKNDDDAKEEQLLHFILFLQLIYVTKFVLSFWTPKICIFMCVWLSAKRLRIYKYVYSRNVYAFADIVDVDGKERRETRDALKKVLILWFFGFAKAQRQARVAPRTKYYLFSCHNKKPVSCFCAASEYDA